MNILAQRNSEDSYFKSAWLLFLAAVLTFILAFVFGMLGSYKFVVLTALIPLLLLLLINFHMVYFLLILGIFLNFAYLNFSHAVVYSALLPVSFLINYRNIKKDDFYVPVAVPLFIYFFTVLLSIINSAKPLYSLYLSYNFVALIIIVFITTAFIKNRSQVNKYVGIYLGLVALNSIHVIVESVFLHKRSFGYAGIMYVDYVGIGIVILVALIIINNRYNAAKVILLALFLLGSLLTQTRNAWIVTMLTVVWLWFYCYNKSDILKIDKKKLVRLLLVILVLIPVILVIAKVVNPGNFERVDVGQTEVAFSNEGLAQNSFVTRLLIWHTALNAFLSHPIIGIGAYSFSFSSHLYYTIPEFLYKMYVEGLSPHVGYLEVLTENGIIGLIAFFVFIVAVIRHVFRTIKKSKNTEELSLMMIVNWPLIYISISLFMTDAWLWGKGVVLWGILIGLSMAVNRLNKVSPLE
ncbi:MAG: O-antigen ligase family protein [Ignavibacteriaceae bacterium]